MAAMYVLALDICNLDQVLVPNMDLVQAHWQLDFQTSCSQMQTKIPNQTINHRRDKFGIQQIKQKKALKKKTIKWMNAWWSNNVKHGKQKWGQQNELS